MSTTSKIISLILLGWLSLPLAAWAKQFPAPVIEPIVHQGIRYTVPNDKGTKAYVVASDAATGKQLWKKTIFRNWICPFVEHDVQWVFIKQMRRDGDRLVLVNERDKTYSLDLKTRSVKKVKQQQSSQAEPNPPPPANPAVAFVVYVWPHWRGVAEAERSASAPRKRLCAS